MTSEILANVIRGETVESIHRGHFIVIDGAGRTIASAGDPSTVTFFRSACKSLQAMPFITSGAADRFGFSEDEIALAVASHSGERIHVETAARMLAKAGLAESDLRCGTHLPFNEAEAHRMIAAGEKPTQLHNNCSGKHAGMLAFAKHIGADLASYESPANSVQVAILDSVARFTEIPAAQIATGVDGCAAPNFAVPIAAMAKSFINLLSPPASFDKSTRSACGRIVAAMLRYPELVGGTGRLDTMMMEVAPGRLISKVGADGVWLCGVLPSETWPTGLGIALKIEDGDDQLSRPTTSVDILRKLGVLAESDLFDVSPMPIRNRRGDTVGRIVSNVRL
ncbi:MAG: asparaginase [Acidobacteriota bacterium]